MSIIRPEIAALNAYHVPPAKGLIKLDAMENPYELPAALKAELAQIVADTAINRYPDPTAPELIAVLRKSFNIPAELDVLLGNGSDEIIQMLAMLVARPKAKLLGLEPSFVMYKMTATFCGMEYVGVSLKQDFSLDVEATLAAIALHQPALIFLAYPNNPTGNAFARQDIETIIHAAPGLVVIDEAYFAFAEDSFLSRLGEHDNVVVIRTLSKLGLAGLRLGFIVGKNKWIEALNKVRMPYNINVLSQIAGTFALQHLKELTEQTQTIIAERARYFNVLQDMPMLQTYTSQANFVLVRVPDAPNLFAYFKEAGILLKNLHGVHPLLENCIRITVGTPEENDQVLSILQRYVNNNA